MKDKKMKIKEAANFAGIGYENAKVIKRIYRREGRNTKICFKNKPRNFRRGDVFINPELEVQKQATKLSPEVNDHSSSKISSPAQISEPEPKDESENKPDTTSDESPKNDDKTMKTINNQYFKLASND